MCHTWGLPHSQAELQGGQGKGHQGVPLQVHLAFITLYFYQELLFELLDVQILI